MPRKKELACHSIEYTDFDGKQHTLTLKLIDEIGRYWYNPEWAWRHIDLLVLKDGKRIDKIKVT